MRETYTRFRGLCNIFFKCLGVNRTYEDCDRKSIIQTSKLAKCSPLKRPLFYVPASFENHFQRLNQPREALSSRFPQMCP